MWEDHGRAAARAYGCTVSRCGLRSGVRVEYMYTRHGEAYFGYSTPDFLIFTVQYSGVHRFVPCV